MPKEKVIKRKIYITTDRKTLDEERGIYEAWISTEALDRDGDILRANGAEIENYLRNPVVLFGHNYRNPEAVIGKAIEVNKVLEGARKGIKLVWQFLKRGMSEFADLVHDLWRDEILNAFSVGFIALEWEDLELPEGEINPYAEVNPWTDGIDFTKWELLEPSIVTIPANQDALRNALKSMEIPAGEAVLSLPCSSCGKITNIGPMTALTEEVPPKCLVCFSKEVAEASDLSPAQAMRQLADGMGIKASAVRARMAELSRDDNIPNDTATTEGAQEIDVDEASHSDLDEMTDEVADQIIELLDTLKENFK